MGRMAKKQVKKKHPTNVFIKEVDGLYARIKNIEKKTGINCSVWLLVDDNFWEIFDKDENPNTPVCNYYIKTKHGLVQIISRGFMSKERESILQIMRIVGMHREINIGGKR